MLAIPEMPAGAAMSDAHNMLIINNAGWHRHSKAHDLMFSYQPRTSVASRRPGHPRKIPQPELTGGRLHPIRSPRRQHFARHVHACGPRPVLEALLAVAAGQALDEVLEDFARLPAEVYRAVGADVLPIDELAVIDGARS